MSRPRVVVAGLGPAGLDLLVPAARAAIDRIPVRFVRTAQHPAVDELAVAGVAFESLDRLYDAGDDLDTVYSAIASYVADAALTHGEVLYAVPGSPSVAERTVLLLRAATVDVEIIPGVSFADIAWARVGIDPLGGARVVDARAFAVEAAGGAGPMLIAQCDSAFLLSDVKLALLEMLRPDHEVTVLQCLGLPDERVFTVALEDLDRDVQPDHLTSLFVDTGELAVASELVRLVALAERLRGPGGCPWDAEQTHHSLRRHVIEEAYEVAEAIDVLPADAPGGDVDVRDYDALEDELGDLLFQVVIQSVLAAETGAFNIADVARRIHDKLVRRHPHVFGDVRVGGAGDVVTNWEQIKKSEKGDDSLVAGITTGLPSLIAVQKLFRKADSIGLTPGIDGDDVGAALAAIAQDARRNDIDADAELARWNKHFKERFERMERAAQADGIDLARADGATVTRLWDAARD